GGKIKAYDRITHYAEQLADYQLAADEQEVVLSTDQAYWQVVSLYNKKKLAENYLDMLRAMQKDVEAMVKEGFTTHANQLSVDVKVNEAEMTLTKVEDGLILSKMLLCETCGLPLDSDIMPEDAKLADINTADAAEMSNMDEALTNRSELKQLEAAINIYEEKVKIERSAFLPQIALVGGYAFYTPNVYNGFSNKIKGDWSIGVTMKVPVWNWGEGKYKVRAAKAEAAMQRLKLSDAREKIMLQVNQSSFRINEANKKLTMSLKNLEKAEENLRTAQVGFKEGVINTTETLAAQTAWLQAQSDKIDAQIDLRLSKSLYQKALGTLRP
ncbi:MAG: TolC family protein, partial [Bacteroidaceae bacterium]|nr:TolC family protein [Bacteroidaceae bacterium]